MRSMPHALAVAVSLTASSSVAISCSSKADDATKTAEPSCKPDPACVPGARAKDPKDDRACTVGSTAVTCPWCKDGGRYAGVDVDGDGCVEAARTECGRPVG